MRAEAENAVGALVGDRVEIETTTSRVLLHAVLVFLMPLFVAVCFYLFGWSLSLAEEICYLLALCGLALAFCGLVLYTRVRGIQVPLRIIRVLENHDLDEGEIE